MHRIFLFIARTLFLTAVVQAQLPFNVVLSSTLNFNLSWAIGADNTTITMQVTVGSASWIGIGWHSVGSTDEAMSNADYVIALFNSDGSLINVTDRYVSNKKDGYSKPVLDTDTPYPGGIDNILHSSGMQYNGFTTFTFQRLLNTSDTKADCPITPGKMRVIYAHGKAGNDFTHGHGHNAGQIMIDFFNGNVYQISSTRDLLIAYHGSFMFAAFGILMPFGIFIARYCKDIWWWFYLHMGAQAFAVASALTGFVTVILAMEQDDAKHFATIHTRLGLATLCMAFTISPILGLVSHLMYNPERAKVPVFPDKTHWWAGRITLVMGWVTMEFGFDELQLPHAVRYSFIVLLGLYMVVTVYMEFAKKCPNLRKNRKSGFH